MFLIALAAQMSLSVPDPQTVFSPDDMPAYVQIAGINRFILTRTTVKPDGKARDCAVERSGGDPKLDALTCAIILKRAAFKPPTGMDGSPTYGVFRWPVSWTIGGPPSKSELRNAFPGDASISVSRLPKGASNPANVRLIVAVEKNGRITNCEIAPRDVWDHSKTFPELSAIACKEVTGQLTLVPATDGSGQSVPSVQSATVSFTANH